MLAAIKEIYVGRVFVVEDDGCLSQERTQRAGISQGCPLSPFLFGIVMTVLIADTIGGLSDEAQAAHARSNLEEVLFADDTLLIGRLGRHVEEYLAELEQRGMDYGLQVHWGKVHLVRVGATIGIKTPTGQNITAKDSMLYLGATIHADGKFGCELSRRLGAANAEFQSLRNLWKNAAVAKARKLQVLESLVLSKVRYAVASAWRSKADLRRLHGFQARCLRSVLKVPPAFLTRVSNEAVRQLAGARALSATVEEAQSALLQKVLMSPHKVELKKAAFSRTEGTLVPMTDAYVRRVGRPRHNWTEEVLKKRRRRTD